MKLNWQIREISKTLLHVLEIQEAIMTFAVAGGREWIEMNKSNYEKFSLQFEDRTESQFRLRKPGEKEKFPTVDGKSSSKAPTIVTRVLQLTEACKTKHLEN